MSDGQPQLGQRLALISKSNIRYEGVLCAIDPEGNTVSLKSVRMFGTENRPTAVPIAASSEVYQYIVFKGKDIKDLTVFSESSPPHDPAIVRAGKPLPRGHAERDSPKREPQPPPLQRGGDHRGGDHRGGDHRGGDHRGGDHRGGDHRGGDHRGGDHRGGGGGDSRSHRGGDYRGGDYRGGDRGYDGGADYRRQERERRSPHRRDHRDYDPRGPDYWYPRDWQRDYEYTRDRPSYGGYGGGGPHQPPMGRGGRHGGGHYDYRDDYGSYGRRDVGRGRGGGAGGQRQRRDYGGGGGRRSRDAYASHTGMEFAGRPRPEKGELKEEFDFGAMMKAVEQGKDGDDVPKEGMKYAKDSFFDTLTYEEKDQRGGPVHSQHATDCETFGSRTVEDYERRTQGRKGKGGKRGGRR